VSERMGGRCTGGAHGQGVEALLACGVPDLIAEHAILEAALLGEECGADCGLFVGLEFVGDLVRSQLMGENQRWDDGKRRTKRRTTEDLPTAASPR
jgi:hypothetical protein